MPETQTTKRQMKTSLISFRVRKAVSCGGEVRGERKKKGEDPRQRSFDLLLGVASNVMHSQRLHSFTIIHKSEENKPE